MSNFLRNIRLINDDRNTDPDRNPDGDLRAGLIWGIPASLVLWGFIIWAVSGIVS